MLDICRLLGNGTLPHSTRVKGKAKAQFLQVASQHDSFQTPAEGSTSAQCAQAAGPCHAAVKLSVMLNVVTQLHKVTHFEFTLIESKCKTQAGRPPGNLTPSKL